MQNSTIFNNFPFEISTYSCFVIISWIGSKHAADDKGSPNIRGWFKSVYCIITTYELS
jgi:hypothetical protein